MRFSKVLLKRIHPARWAARLGIDRNPLRRRTDRIETFIRLGAIIVFLAVASAAIAEARPAADHLKLRQAHAPARTIRQVTAVLLKQAPTAVNPDPFGPTQMTAVQARWQPPGQAPRSGQVVVPPGARTGTAVTIWVDAAGHVTGPPSKSDGPGGAGLAVILICLAAGLLLAGVSKLAGRILERRRLNAWDAEWREIGPLWRGRRS
jgi:hypothetical protein